MAQRGYKVVQYDASIEQSPDKHPNIVLHKKFIADFEDKTHTTIKNAITQNGFEKGADNILQCDIEGSEYEMLESIDIENLSHYFTQIIFEFHGLNPEEMSEAQRRAGILRELNKHYVPIHTHLNNHGKIFYSKHLFFSTTIEVSYLRKDKAAPYRAYRAHSGALQGLDYPTFLPNPELPLRFETK